MIRGANPTSGPVRTRIAETRVGAPAAADNDRALAIPKVGLTAIRMWLATGRGVTTIGLPAVVAIEPARMTGRGHRPGRRGALPTLPVVSVHVIAGHGRTDRAMTQM